VVTEIGSGFEVSSLAMFTGTVVDVVSVFSEEPADKAAAVHFVVLCGEVVVAWVPFVGELGNLDAAADSHGLHGRLKVLSCHRQGVVQSCWTEHSMRYWRWRGAVVAVVTYSLSFLVMSLRLWKGQQMCLESIWGSYQQCAEEQSEFQCRCGWHGSWLWLSVIVLPKVCGHLGGL